MSVAPEPTLDGVTSTRIDLARARYDAAWQQALVCGGAPPDRESFLSGAGDERSVLSSALNTIDGAYTRLRELVRSGVRHACTSPGSRSRSRRSRRLSTSSSLSSSPGLRGAVSDDRATAHAARLRDS